MIKLTSKFPFIYIVKGSYETIVMNDNKLTLKQRELINFIDGILSVDGISTYKIRYVFNNPFLYDIDSNKINSKYQIIRPINFGRKKKLDIEIGKPENSHNINIIEYIDIDDISKETVKSSKRGIVLFVEEYQFYGKVGIVDLDFIVENITL